MQREEIERLQKSRRTDDRIRAATALRRQGGPIDLLMRGLGDRSAYVAALAAEGLAEAADESCAAEMTERLLWFAEDGPKRDPGCHIRAHLAIGLGRLDYLPAADALRQGLRTVQIELFGGAPFDAAAHLRANCAQALAQMNAIGAVRDIAGLLFDCGNNAVDSGRGRPVVPGDIRQAAAQALARAGGPDALIPLTIKLRFPGDEDLGVLAACMQAVVDLDDARAPELLAPYLQHRDQDLAAHAALMLARTRDPDAHRLIGDIVPDLYGDALRTAVLALMTLRTEGAWQTVRDLAVSRREEVRLACVEALGTAVDKRNHAALAAISDGDVSAAVREAARQALAAFPEDDDGR